MKKKVLAWVLSAAMAVAPAAQATAFASSVEEPVKVEQTLGTDFSGEEQDGKDETDPNSIEDSKKSGSPEASSTDEGSSFSENNGVSSDNVSSTVVSSTEGNTASDDEILKESEEDNKSDVGEETPNGTDTDAVGENPSDTDDENADTNTGDGDVVLPTTDTDSTASENTEESKNENSDSSSVVDDSSVQDDENEDPDASKEDGSSDKEEEDSEDENASGDETFDEKENPTDIEEEGEESSDEEVAGLSENEKYYKPKNGTYVFDSCFSGTNIITLKNSTPGGNLKEGGTVLITDSTTDLGVYWILKKNDDDSYQITNFASGLALTASNTNIVQKTYSGADTQKWYFRHYGDTSYTSITPKSNMNYRISLAGSTKKFANNGSSLILTKLDKTYQKWYIKARTSPAVSLADGDYYLYPGNKSTKALYVTSNSKAEDAPMQLYTWLGRRGEWFTVKSLGKGNLYTIVNTYSGKALYPKKGAKTYGTVIVQHTADGSLDQAWRLVDKDGSYQLIHVMSGMALGLSGGKFVNGTEPILDMPKDTDSQKWTFVAIDTVGKDTKGADAKLAAGYYRLTNAAKSSLVASTAGSRKKTGMNLELADSDAKERATFYIKPLSNGKYAIRSFFSFKYVGMNYDVAENNYKLETKDNYSAATSKWYIRKSTVDDGQLSIVNAANTAMVLTFDGDAAEGAQLKITLSSGEKAQRWTSTKMVNQKPLTDGERYVLTSQLNTGLVMSVTSTTAGTGETVLRQTEQQPWEVYIFEYVGPSNIYRLRNQWSGKVLAGSTKKDGEKVTLVNEADEENQLWHVRAMGSARYSISNVKTSKLLTVKDGNASAGTSVVVNEANGKSSQLWVMHKAKSIEKVPTNVNIVISPKGTNNVLEVKDGSLVDRTPMQFATPTKAANQVFQIIPSGNYYKLRSVATGRYLTSSSGKATLRPSISGKAQLWKVLPSGIRYNFRNVGNGRYLNSPDGSFTPGLQLVVSAEKMPSLLTYASVSGWQYVSGGLRYYNEDGSYAKNTFLNYNNNLVAIGSDGFLRTGWIKYGSYYYYFNGSAGQIKTDARPYISKLYPTRRAGIWRPESTGPACEYRITVDRQQPCRVTVYTKYPGESEWNVPVVSYICSTGADATPTAPGERKTIHDSRWQPLMGPSYGQYGMAILLRDENGEWFINGDFFHSLACQEPNDHNLDVGSYNILGTRASHGCCRLNVRNAYWQFNFVPDNSGVYVGDDLARPLNALPQPYASGSVDPTDPNYTGNYGYTENGVYYNPAGFH